MVVPGTSAGMMAEYEDPARFTGVFWRSRN